MLSSMRVLLRSLLAGVVVALVALLAWMDTARGAAAQAGAMDLRHWDFARDLSALDGQWQFAPGRLLSPSDPWPAGTAMLEVPGSWNAVQDAHGFGTYRLHVDCASDEPLALGLPLQHSAYRLYVNGQLVARQGQPGRAGEGHAPGILRQQVLLPARACPMDILVQMSNQEWLRGGLVRSIQMGTQALMAERREQALTRSGLAVGSTLMVALFSLSFFFAYAARRRDRTPLYFGLFCLSFVVSMGLAAERLFQPYVGWLGFDAQVRLLFVNWLLGLAMFPLFLGSLYPREAGRWPLRLIWGFCAGAAAVTLLSPVRVFITLAPALQLAGVVTALYVGTVLVRALLNGRFAAGVLLVGLVVLIAAVVHDVAFYQHLLATSMLPYGMLGFVIAPAVLLSLRLARALAAEELRLLEQRGRTDMLLRATNAGVLDWDMVRGHVEYSERLREMLGYGPSEELPPMRELLHQADRDAVMQRFVDQLRDRGVRSGLRHHAPADFRLRRADGQERWVHGEGIAICGSDGRTLRFIGSFIDISERKRHEQEMSNRIKFIDDLFDSVPLGLVLRDTEGRYLYVNRTWERYVGMSRHSVLGTSLRDVRDAAAEAALALDAEALARGPGMENPPHEYDYNGRRLIQNRTVMADAEGRAIGVLVASLDITDKHQIEKALATERERLRLLVRSTKAGFGDWDTARDVVTYSSRFKEMLGYPTDYDTSQWPSIFEMMHPDDRERARGEFRDMIRRKAAGGEQEPGEPMSYRLRRRDGSYIWIHAEGISQVDEAGRTRRFITSYLDVTHFHEQEQALRSSRDEITRQAALLEQQNEALKENVRLREEVERIGRHDLKTPLNSIIAVPRLLREERRLGPEADELLGIVERAGYRILSMVNLSLDLYKMEQGSYAFRPDAVDLAELAHKVIADVRMHAASKQVRLHVQAWQAPYAWAEELLCYSLLANLLKNAVEASPEGAVVQLTIEAGPEESVQLRIHNDGVVPLFIRASFFQKYATLGKASGTGLGTYSARLMARVQDGDVMMNTSDEAGTTLTVRLRAAPAGKVPANVRHATERPGAGLQLPAGLPPMRVLLVDDDEYNLLIVRRFLPSPPFEVDTAINGRVALAAAELQWPDLIFMDLDMPVMGGLEAVSRLRALERATLAKRCTMVALSSHEDEETQRRALAAGFDRYLVKPVTRDAIHETLVELHMLIGEAPRARPPAPSPVPVADDVVHLDPDIEPVLGDFLASRRTLVTQLDEAISREDRAEVRRIAHQLAGSFALYGFGWASERARWLEKNFSELPTGEVRDVAVQLRRHLDTVQIRYVDGG